MSVENNIKTLQQLANELESDSLDLNKAADLYASSIKLAKKTLDALDKIQQNIVVLNQDAESILNHDSTPNN